MSLRSLIMLLVGWLVAVALMFAISDVRQSQARYAKALALAEQNQVADHCLQTMKNFAFERGRSTIALRSPSSITPENRQFIDERRAAADLPLEKMRTRFPEVSREKGETVQRAWDYVKALRVALDKNVSRPLGERDAALPDQWMAGANELVASLDALLSDLSHSSLNIDASFERMNNLRVFVLQFRDLLGSEASALAVELSLERVPNLALIHTITTLRGRSTQLWLQIEPGVEWLADRDATLAVEKIRTELFNRLRPLQDLIISQAGRGQREPIPLNDYLGAAISALDSSVELADAINHAASVHIENSLNVAKQEEWFSLASIAAILILAGLIVMVLMRRFTRPLNGIRHRIDTLIGRQTGTSPTNSAYSTTVAGDDFDRVSQALELLDVSIEARLQSEAALNDSERIKASILACIPQSVIGTDINGLIIVFSPGAETLLGYTAEEIVGKHTPLLFHDSNEITLRAKELSGILGSTIEPGFEVFVAVARMASTPEAREWTYIRKDGQHITVLLTVTFLRNARGEVTGCLGVASDITERTRIAVEMARLAYHDPLTHLPNRRLFQDRLQMALNQAQREQSRLALLLIDLDQFKPVNDRYGHAIGDVLLSAVARRMQACLRESDTLARVGGDEFMAVLTGIGLERDAVAVAEKIRLALNEPFELAASIVVEIACSIGIAIYPDHGKTEKRLSKNADDAMYHAKELGRNRVQLYSEYDEGREAVYRNLSVMHLVWHNSFRCGVAAIDQEHQALFDRANTLIGAVMSTGEKSVHVHTAMQDLIKSVTDHFRDEESILASFQWDGLEDHKAKHRKLLERADELRELDEAGELKLGEVVTFLAQEVVAKHMIREDKKFFPLLRKALNQEPAERV